MLGWCTLPGSLGLLCLKQWPGVLDSETSPSRLSQPLCLGGKGFHGLLVMVVRRSVRRGGE